MTNDQLILKMRESSQLFLGSDAPTELGQIIEKLADLIDASLLLFDSAGTLLAGQLSGNGSPAWLSAALEEGQVDDDSPAFALLKITEPRVNTAISTLAPKLGGDDLVFSLEPLTGGGKRLGTLLASRGKDELSDDQQKLLLYSTGLLSMLMFHLDLERSQEDARNKALAAVAFESLSYSEVEAIQEVLKKVQNNESVIVASKIADSLGITRSVIVNALRKFESAGIIESRSLGMKGTYIKVKNIQALDEVASHSEKMRGSR